LKGVADRVSRRAALILAVLAPAGCHAVRRGNVPLVQPGVPGSATHVIAAERATAPPRGVNAADVAFMQGMIGHHAQAVEMVGLLQSRTTRDDMRALGLRIEVSQNDEMRFMRRWLDAHGQPQPSPHAHHGDGAVLMPGMLTADEMARLGDAHGPGFDRLFLEGMIKHHTGALTMVRDLFAVAGAGQDPEVFAFASDVDADQRMEIERMRALLDAR
jgi:uncharacterized protein (DUF305 family)